MKKLSMLLGIFVLGAGVSAVPAFADSTATFTVNGTYLAGSPTTPFSAPGNDFTLTFSLPTKLGLQSDYMANDDFYLYPVTVEYSTNGMAATPETALVAFYTPTAVTQSGGFFVDICATDVSCLTGFEYQWTFAGPQQYKGNEKNPKLTPSNFSFSSQPFIVYKDVFTELDGAISGTVTTSVVATPEPSSLAMLAVGLLGLAALGLRRSL